MVVYRIILCVTKKKSVCYLKAVKKRLFYTSNAILENSRYHEWDMSHISYQVLDITHAPNQLNAAGQIFDAFRLGNLR